MFEMNWKMFCFSPNKYRHWNNSNAEAENWTENNATKMSRLQYTSDVKKTPF